jgi:hypothetical protein
MDQIARSLADGVSQGHAKATRSRLASLRRF